MKKILALFICLFTLVLGGCGGDKSFSDLQSIQNQDAYSYEAIVNVIDMGTNTRKNKFYASVVKSNNEYHVSFSNESKSSEAYQELGSFIYKDGVVSDVKGEEIPVSFELFSFDNYVFEKDNYKNRGEGLYDSIDDKACFKGDKLFSNVQFANHLKKGKGELILIGYDNDGYYVNVRIIF